MKTILSILILLAFQVTGISQETDKGLKFIGYDNLNPVFTLNSSLEEDEEK